MTAGTPLTALGAVTRGATAGVAATVVMTAFQRLVEMPLTGRSESDAPLRLVERLLPIRRTHGDRRRALVYVAHFGIGALWGAGHGLLVQRTGVTGARAVATVFATQYGGDVALSTALGVYRPSEWTAQDWLVDVADKVLLAGVTSRVYERLASA